ncbi:MAG: P-loop NTPase fold protein [Marinicella sp.]
MSEFDTSISFEKRDEFDRRPIAVNIINLLTSDVNVSPMVIDGSWGCGKTEFSLKLINLFKEQHPNYNLVYIDAFQTDYQEDPLLSILSEIIQLLPNDETQKAFKKTATAVLKVGTKTVLKGGVNWILRQDSNSVADDWDEAIADAADNAINKSIDKLLDQQIESESSFKALTASITKITQDKPIIFFIDELDRCKPDFAVRLLEKIKHVFDIDNVQFVLIANKEQLRSSINHCYGLNIDSQKYLDKFLCYSLSLPEVKSKGYGYELNSHNHFLTLIKNSNVLNTTYLSTYDYSSFTKTLFLENRISLREAETFIRYMEIAQTIDHSFNKPDIGVMLLNLLGIFIFCFKPNILTNIDNNKIDAKEINSLLGVSGYNHNSFNSNSSPSRVSVISLLIYLNSNINALKEAKDFGVSEKFFEKFTNFIEPYFNVFNSLGHESYLNILYKIIKTLRLDS